MPRAARIVNARSSAAPSPPTRSSRVPATFAERSAARSSSTGASIANDIDCSARSRRARSVARRARRHPNAVAGPGRWARPMSTSDTYARAAQQSRARRALPRRRAAGAEAGGTRSSPRARAEWSHQPLPRRSSVRKSPKSWRERSFAVPTSTRRRPRAFGSAPRPRSRSTSQRAAVQVRGRRPERRSTCRRHRRPQ